MSLHAIFHLLSSCFRNPFLCFCRLNCRQITFRRAFMKCFRRYASENSVGLFIIYLPSFPIVRKVRYTVYSMQHLNNLNPAVEQLGGARWRTEHWCGASLRFDSIQADSWFVSSRHVPFLDHQLSNVYSKHRRVQLIMASRGGTERWRACGAAGGASGNGSEVAVLRVIWLEP